MQIFKLKILVDEVSDVIREIEVKPSQTFKQLHDTLVDQFELRKGRDSSFFVSNARWQKTKEIPIGHEGLGDADITSTSTIDAVIPVSSKWLIYFNEGHPQLNFLIEVVNTSDEQTGRKYPFCTKKVGQLTAVGGMGSEVFEDELGISFDDEFDDYSDDLY